MADQVTLENALTEAVEKYTRGEMTVEQLTALAVALSKASAYVEDNVTGPLGTLVEEFQSLDLDGYLVSLYHNNRTNSVSVVSRWPGHVPEWWQRDGTGLAVGYDIFEDEKRIFRRRLREYQLEKYGDEE